MKRFIVSLLRVVSLAFLALSFSSQDALAGGTSLVGTWTLVSVDSISPDGTRTHPYGPNAVGLAMFDAAGRYTIQIQSSDRPKFVSDDRLKGTPEENLAFVRGVNPHFGRYSVNDADRTITLHIEHAAFPNWDGTDQVRPFTLIGNELKYVTPVTATNGRTVEVVWQRAK